MIASGRTFDTLLRLSLDQIRLCAGGNVAVLSAIFLAIAHTARQTDNAHRLQLLHEQARLAAAVAADTLDYDYDRETVRRSLADACRVTSPSALRLPEEWLPPKNAVHENV